MVQTLLNKTAAEIDAAHPHPQDVGRGRVGAGAPCRRFGALIASTMGKDKKRAPAPPAKKNDGDPSGYGLPPEPSLASSAAMRAFKASFSSRASRAISLTASNSSRLTTSRSRDRK